MISFTPEDFSLSAALTYPERNCSSRIVAWLVSGLSALLPTWQVRLGAARSEGAGHTEHDKLAAAGELRQVDLLIRSPLKEIHGGDGVPSLDRCHAAGVQEESVGGDAENRGSVGKVASERLHCSLRTDGVYRGS